MQFSFFEESDRLKKLSKIGDILEKLSEMVDFKQFVPILDKAIRRAKTPKGGRPAYNNLLMF